MDKQHAVINYEPDTDEHKVKDLGSLNGVSTDISGHDALAFFSIIYGQSVFLLEPSFKRRYRLLRVVRLDQLGSVLLTSADIRKRHQDSGAKLRNPENRRQTEVWI